MATPYRISIGVDIDASGAKRGSAETRQEVSAIAAEAEKAVPKIESVANAARKLESVGRNDAAAASIDAIRASAIGAIPSIDQVTEALSRQRKVALQSIDAINDNKKSLQSSGNQRFQSANLAFQLQDIATTAPFMPWYTVALQQGPQVAAVLDTLEDKSAGLAAAFMSLVSPWSLLSIAAVSASAFAIQYFTSVEDQADKADAALQGHTEIIRRIREAYGEAAKGLRDYANESDTLLQQDIADRIKSYREAILDTAKSLEGALLSVPAERFGGATYTILQIESALNQLSEGIRSGEPDLRSFVERLVDIENQKGTPVEIRNLIKELRDSAAAGLTAERALQPLVGTINGVGAAAAAQAQQVSELSKALRSLNGLSLPSLSPLEQAAKLRDDALKSAAGATEAGVNQIMAAYDRAIQRVQDTNPTVLNVDGRQVAVPTPDNKPVRLGEATSKANTSAANSYRDLVKSADDRIGQMRLEAEMAGQVGIEADALRFKLDLVQRSEDKGRSISEKQREEINKKVEAFKAYAEAAATAKLRADLLWESEQAGRSWMDQQIAGRLRSSGLDIDFDSAEADLIRMNLALEASKSYAADFTDTLFDGIGKSEDLFDSLADAGIAAFKRLGKSLWDDVLNMLFSAQSGGGSGLLGGILSFFGGGGSAAADPWSGLRSASASVATASLGVSASTAKRSATVQPMLPASRSVDQVAQASAGAISRLKVEVGLASDAGLNIRPQVVGVVQETAPDIAMELIEQNNDGEASRVARHNRRPRWS